MTTTRSKSSDTDGNRSRNHPTNDRRHGHDGTRSVTVVSERTSTSERDTRGGDAPAADHDHPLVQFQRRHGNQAVQRFVSGVVQPSLRVGPAGDKYEKEADAAASRVARGRPVGEVSHLDPGTVQRQPLQEREDELAVGASKAAAADEKKGVKAATPEAVKPGAKEEVKPEVKKEATREVKEEAKPEVKKAAKPEVKEEAKPEIKKEAKPEVKEEAKPEVKKEAKPEVKKEATREVKEEAKPEVKKEAKPEVKEEAKKEIQKDLGTEPEMPAAGKPGVEEKKKELVQRKATKPMPGSGLRLPSAGLPSGSGESLAPESRRFFEGRFGRDFGGVRVHADGRADAAARALDAKAFTHGRDVYFRSGQYRPDTVDGQRLLAHELTHTVQQRPTETPRRDRQPSTVD